MLLYRMFGLLLENLLTIIFKNQNILEISGVVKRSRKVIHISDYTLAYDKSV